MADVPENAISEKFLAGSGPGGQNVNKVATACQLRVDVYALGLAPDAFRRLKVLAGSRLTSDGELVILRTVDIIKQEPLEKGATYFVRFEKVEPETVPEFNR